MTATTFKPFTICIDYHHETKSYTATALDNAKGLFIANDSGRATVQEVVTGILVNLDSQEYGPEYLGLQTKDLTCLFTTYFPDADTWRGISIDDPLMVDMFEAENDEAIERQERDSDMAAALKKYPGKNHIELFLSPDTGWMAKYDNPRVVELFETDTLATAFTEVANPVDVLCAVQHRNPEFEVTLKLGTEILTVSLPGSP